MFYIFGVGLNLFLLVLLVSKKNKSYADKILTAWLFVIACHLSLYVLSIQPITSITIHQMGWGIPFPFLHGPFLYWYTAALTNQFPSNRKALWLHFVPAALAVLAILPLALSSTEYKMEVFRNGGKDYEVFRSIVAWLMQVSGICYAVWLFYLLRRHKRNIGQLFSYEDRINLNWLRYLIYSLLVVWVVIIFTQKDSFIFTAVVLFVMVLGFFGIRQVGIFDNNSPIKLKVNVRDENLTVVLDNEEVDEVLVENESVDRSVVEQVVKRKYATSGISAEMISDMHNRLQELMNKEKAYTEPELSLADLAAKLRVHPNYLSQTINEREGKSFFDYINNLRVEEFKRLAALPESSQFTIMSLALDCGFNSKSTFNKNFKKVTGLSPSDYISGLSKD